MENALLAAVLFIETLANKICHYHYRKFHLKFQEKNKFPLTRSDVDFTAWGSIVDAKSVFEMALRQIVYGKLDEATEKWLAKVLSGSVDDMRWIVLNSLSRDEEVDKEIDKEEFWSKCVERFPDWLKKEGLTSVRPKQ